MLSLISLFAASAAHASVDFEVKAPATVTVFVDGQRAAYTSRLRQRVSDLEPGTHEVRVASVLGKTLFEDEIELVDGTRTTGEWARGELVISTEPQTQPGPEAEAGAGTGSAASSISNAEAAIAEPVVPEDGAPEEAKGGKVAAILESEREHDPALDSVVEGPGEAVESSEALESPGPVYGPPAGPPVSLPLARPVDAEPSGIVDDSSNELPPPTGDGGVLPMEEGTRGKAVTEATLFEAPYGEVEEVPLPNAEVAESTGTRTISIEAPEGVAVEVVHGGQVVRVVSEGGRLYVVDTQGVRIDLGPATR